jgi:RNA polymerase sigma-70 factor (ECF subfamily)
VVATAVVSQGGAAGMDEDGEDGSWSVPSWDEIVRDHSSRVYRLAYRLTGNRHDAEDLTQEVFVRVFQALPTYRPGTFEGWIYRITTNLFLDQARRRRRIRFDALPLDFGDRMPGPTPTPDHEVARDLFDPDIEAALAELPPEYRAAVVLCDVEGLTYEEIARALDVKLGTVRSRIHRGRSMLRKALRHRAPTAARTRYGGPVESSLGEGLDSTPSGPIA